jgi:hypothetical protein
MGVSGKIPHPSHLTHLLSNSAWNFLLWVPQPPEAVARDLSGPPHRTSFSHSFGIHLKRRKGILKMYKVHKLLKKCGKVLKCLSFNTKNINP